jgi:hypothetical protein
MAPVRRNLLQPAPILVCATDLGAVGRTFESCRPDHFTRVSRLAIAPAFLTVGLFSNGEPVADPSYTFSANTPQRPGGCFTCVHFGRREGRLYVLCEKDKDPIVMGNPERGCVFWMREPGSDDETPGSIEA